MPCASSTAYASLAAALLSLQVVAAPPEPNLRALNVDTNIAIGYGLALADVDGDRRIDILLCEKSQIAWYQNPSWQKYIIAEKLTS